MLNRVSEIERQRRLSRLRSIVLFAAAALFLKVFLSILYEYRSYFPADFDSAFLSGRRDSFYGPYCVAFYAHIISSPVSLIAAMFLLFSGRLSQQGGIHRYAGRLQAVIVLAVVAPSGLFMSMYAFAGPVAGAGLATLSIATAGCLVFAVRDARLRRFSAHRRWASRCCILLVSPLLLRLISGAAIVSQLDSDWFYRLNAWFSWLAPLLIYETCRWFGNTRACAPTRLIPQVPEEVTQ